MINVLHVVVALDGGGVEQLLYNYYKHINRKKIHFDFIVHDPKVGILEPKFTEMGSKIFRVTQVKNSIRNNIIDLNRIFKSSKYDIVHIHQGYKGVFSLYFAYKYGYKIRIVHSHLAYEKGNLKQKAIRVILSLFVKKFSTHWFACSTDAGHFLWGDKAVSNEKVYILNNAIDIGKFTFDKNTRDSIRNEFNLDGKFVIGNVGRFTYQKNHEFLIKVFKEIYEKDKDAVLLLIGNGELENEVRQQVKELGLNEATKFLGVRTDVQKLLQAMDIFVLPSRFEGLGIVYIEAQASGMVCFGSDVVVPKEAKVTELMHFVSLEQSPKYWANQILEYKVGYKRLNTAERIKYAGFDIRMEARKLELFYENVCI